ncbi:MAG: TIGR03986 family CRISPR-associated RAMP protein [Chloroflexus sp.]|uniref:TIGR03986 family type III CRISPR-associated RAMP protein n=1 Tax=Chloroflexus sp. TaxID=1904827 RepID=UPI0030B6E655
MNPKHHNPTMKRRDKDGNEFWAHAPYNFVPLPEKVVTVDAEAIPGHDVYTEYTGYIDCILETRSPIYTRCAMSPDFFKEWAERIQEMMRNNEARNKYAQFFHLDDAETPIIPGSSLRGMVRTLVEIVGYGKVQPVTDQLKIAFRSVAAPSDDPLSRPYKDTLRNVKVGYLERRGDTWMIHPAQRPTSLGLPERGSYLKVKDRPELSQAVPGLIRFREDNYRPQYHKVRFDCETKKDKRGRKCVRVVNIGGQHSTGKYAGVLICSGNMAESGEASSSKRSTYVLVLERDHKLKPVPIPLQVIQDYVDSLTDFQKEPPFDQRYGCLLEEYPVFYLEADQQVIAFGHTPNFRIPAWFVDERGRRAATPLDFVPVDLRNSEQTDLAEVIFGYVKAHKQDNRSTSCAGRVFFSDARFELAKDGVWLSEEPITPRVLASPKPTTFQHYLVQDRGKGHDPDNKQQLAHYATPPVETAIRGHKMYWHRGPVETTEVQEQSEVNWSTDTQHTSIRPVKAGVRFCFRIYFENLRDFELGALLWALVLSGEDGKDYCHSLGMGKPLGMGAVKITPTLYLSDRKSRYRRLFGETDWHRDEREEKNIDQFIRAFENFILQRMDTQERGQAQSLKEVERIKMLLKMLEWPGPDRQLTEYMTIEPTNEYKERPVLPDPLHIGEPLGNTFPSTVRQVVKPRDKGKRKKRNK